MRDECEHGHLRRSCDMCNVIADHVREITEKNAEIAELRYSLSQAHSVAQACAARAERAEAALRELGKHPESCGDDCVSELARQDALAELAALRAEVASAHAAQRHAEKELSQYMAWYAMAEHQHLHEQRRAEKAEAEREELRADSELLRRIVEAQFIDGFGDVDFHEEAAIAAAENGREEPNTRDYIAAWRVAMEAER